METSKLTPSGILIIGTGHLGCALAVVIASQGIPVQMWANENHRSTFKKIAMNGGLSARGLVTAHVSPTLTTDLAEALRNSTLVILTLPASARAEFIDEAAGLFNDQHTLVVIPGKHFAFEIDAHKRISPHFIVEIGSSPYATKLDPDIESVVANVKAPKDKLDVAVYQTLAAALGPNGNEDQLMKDLEGFPSSLFKNIFPHSTLVERPLFELNLRTTGPVTHSVAGVANIERILRQEVFYFYRDGMARTPGVPELQQKISDVKAEIATCGGWQYEGLLQQYNEFYHQTMGRYWINLQDFAETTPIHNAAPGMPKSTEHRYLTEELPELLKNAAYGHVLGIDVSPILELLAEADRKMPNKLYLIDQFRSGAALQAMGMADLSAAEIHAKYGPNGWLMPKHTLFS